MRAHLAANPEDPCLVFPDGQGDWRWRSWGWLAARAGEWAAALGELSAEAPSEQRVGYRWRPTAEALAADLGIQAAGGVAVPLVEGDEAALPPLARWLAVGGEGPPEGVVVPVVELAPTGTALPPALGGPVMSGGALVRRHQAWEEWGTAYLAAAALTLAVEDDSRPGERRGRRRRPIALVAGDLAAAAERAWLGWALAAGAALVLPGDPAFAAWAIFWPRPTDVCLPAEQLTPVRELLATLGTRRVQRRRLARLRRLLVWGGAPVPEEQQAWAALGVTLSRFDEDLR